MPRGNPTTPCRVDPGRARRVSERPGAGACRDRYRLARDRCGGGLTRHQFRNAERPQAACMAPNRSAWERRGSPSRFAAMTSGPIAVTSKSSPGGDCGRAVANESAGGGTRREVGKARLQPAAESGLDIEDPHVHWAPLKRQPLKRVTGQSLAPANRQRPPASGGSGFAAFLDMTPPTENPCANLGPATAGRKARGHAAATPRWPWGPERRGLRFLRASGS